MHNPKPGSHRHSGVDAKGRGSAWYRAWLCSLLVCGGIFVGPAAYAQGEVYRFTDERGVIHLTNVPPDRNYEVFVSSKRGIRIGPLARMRASKGSAYDALIRRASKKHQLEPALVKAVIAAESNFDPLAVSRQGAQGLMQLMPATARELGVKNAFAPEDNVQGGARYLRRMLTRFGDLRRALAAYNAGPTAVDRYRGVPPFPETEAYVDRVLTYYLGYGRSIGP